MSRVCAASTTSASNRPLCRTAVLRKTADAADATPDEQIRVAVAFATYYMGGPNAAPDQNGCDGGY